MEPRHVFECPKCRKETPHQILTKRSNLLGIACLNCETPSLVKKEVFQYYQEHWEDELRILLTKLDNDHNDHDE